MKRSDFWRLSYRARPYLAHLTEEELSRRSQDLMANIGILTSQGQIGLHSPTDATRFPWMEMWSHVVEEFGRRGKGLREDAIDREALPRPSAPSPAKGYLESQKLGRDVSHCLVKYGNRAWLRTTLETGNWRVSPASFYSDTNLDKARKDSELEFPIRAAILGKTSMPVEGIEGEFYHELKGEFQRDVKAPSDFYLVSLARGLIYRMFDDFHSDACLIVHNEKEFTRRMLLAFDSANPSSFGTFRHVDYVDPYLPKPPIDIRFVKHFRFAYQEEERFVWHPVTAPTKLVQISITLGPLNDICELMLLDDQEIKSQTG